MAGLEHDGVFDGVIDLYGENECHFDEIAASGVTAIIHRASIGLLADHVPDRYVARREDALRRGLLWGAFHFLTRDPVDAQLAAYLRVEDGQDPRVLMAIDWEGETRPSVDQLHDFVGRFVLALGFHPVLYGGHELRETGAIVQGDALLAKCPLWYARYDTQQEAKLEIPRKTWPDYSLWQFCDQRRHNGAPFPPDVMKGADFSRFKGSKAQLAAAWPFRRPAR